MVMYPPLTGTAPPSSEEAMSYKLLKFWRSIDTAAVHMHDNTPMTTCCACDDFERGCTGGACPEFVVTSRNGFVTGKPIQSSMPERHQVGFVIFTDLSGTNGTHGN